MHPNKFKSLIKECIIEVLKEDLAEAFDPTSQGPNPIETNPYPQWNSKMRKLEEIGANNSSFSDEDIDNMMQQAFEKISNIVHQDLANPIPQKLIQQAVVRLDPTDYVLKNGNYYPTIEYLEKAKRNGYKGKISGISENEHGRYAQNSSAGQFDPKTFGVNENNQCICKKCQNKFDYNSIPEVHMGFVKCPSCQAIIDQEGNPAKTSGVNEYAFPEQEPSKNIKFPKSVVDIARIIDQVCSEKGEDITNHLKIGYSRQNKCWILKGSKYLSYLMYLPDRKGWAVVYGNTPTILKPKDVIGYAKRWLG